MIWYHGTANINNKVSIQEDGFFKSYGRFGTGVYFSDSLDYAMSFGSNVVSVQVDDDSEVAEIYYPSLVGLYPHINFDEEEGITELRGYVTDELMKKGVVLTYSNGEKELCIYDTSIIKIL